MATLLSNLMLRRMVCFKNLCQSLADENIGQSGETRSGLGPGSEAVNPQ
jgi:hypothetical protein